VGFTPSAADVLEEINNNTIEGLVAVAQAAPRLMYARCFAQHFESKPNGIQVRKPEA
jgi:dynein heavy chain